MAKDNDDDEGELSGGARLVRQVSFAKEASQ